MELKYKYGRCSCGGLVRLYNRDKCDIENEIFLYDCPICHSCGITKAINPNIADTQEILSKFPDEKEENIKSEEDLDINISELIHETMSQVELLTIGIRNLKTIIKKFIWGEDFTTEEKDMMINILKEEDEEENE